MTQACPLCGSQRLSVWGRLAARDLERIYRRAFGLAIDPLTARHDEIRLLRCADCDLGHFTPAIAGDVRFYEALESFEWYYTESKPEFDFASKFVLEADDVLEIGCGAGHFARKIRCRSYLGLELTSLAAQRARAGGLRVLEESVEAHAAAHPGSYDVVCAFQVLEHVPQTASFLRAALHCLRPGGKLIVSVPSADGYVGRAKNNCLNLPPHHVTWWSDDALKSLGRVLDLEMTRLEHEPLADQHLEAYAHTLISSAIDQPPPNRSLVDLSLKGRVVFRLASLAVPLLARGLRACGLQPPGHSVTVVYRR